MTNAIRNLKILLLAACIEVVMACEATSLGADIASPISTGAVKKVTVIADTALGEPARYGIQKLEAALRDKGVEVSEGDDQISGSDLVLLAGLGAGTGAAATALTEMKVPAPVGAESLVIRTQARYHEKSAIVLAGSDDVGLMYAALDLADRVGWAAKGTNLFQFAQDVAENPISKSAVS